jgi:HlyD family secretion protein
MANKNKPRSRKLIFAVLGLAAAAGLSYVAFRPQAVPVDLGRAAVGEMRVTVSGSGTTRIRNIYRISSPVGGQLLRIEGDVGDAVLANDTIVASILPQDPELLDLRARGQVEAQIAASEAALGLSRAELSRSMAELTYARADLQRTQRLASAGNASRARLDEAQMMVDVQAAAVNTAESALHVAEFDLQAARARLIEPEVGETGTDAAQCCIRLRSPISGQILQVFRESRAVIAAGTPILEIGNARELEIVADLLSEDAVKVSEGANVEISQWGGDEPLSGVVQRVEPFGFEEVSALGIEEQRVNVIIDIVSLPETWSALGHGFSVETHIEIWARDDALHVPTGALIRVGESWAVFAVDGTTANLVRVETGRSNGRQTEIIEGLDDGADVILYPSDRISDGVVVVAREVE